MVAGEPANLSQNASEGTAMTVRSSPIGLDAARTAGFSSAEQLLPGHPSNLAVWGEGDHSTLVCRQVQDVTHDVKNFVFAAPEGRSFEFEAGQFLTLQLEIGGEPVSRCYTVSSPPTRPHRLAITVKRVQGGPVSNWLHDTVRPGTRVAALAPVVGNRADLTFSHPRGLIEMSPPGVTKAFTVFASSMTKSCQSTPLRSLLAAEMTFLASDST